MESTIFFVNDLVMWFGIEPCCNVGEELLSNSFGTLNTGLLTYLFTLINVNKRVYNEIFSKTLDNKRCAVSK